MDRSKGKKFGTFATVGLFSLSGLALADTIVLMAQRSAREAIEAPSNDAASNGPTVSSVGVYDELFSFALDNGCTYGASIRGTIRPIVSGADAGKKLEPDLAVTAVLACPGSSPIKVSERVASTGPLTRVELERMLARKASILSEEGGRKCSYVPEIELPGEGLVAAGVTYLCPLPRR